MTITDTSFDIAKDKKILNASFLLRDVIPQPQERPRATVRGGRLWVYKDKYGAAYQKMIRNMVDYHLREKKIIVDTWDKYPLRIDFAFYFEYPKQHRRENGELKKSAPLYHITKPDISNLVKSVEDALNGILWRDDSQIMHVGAQKFFSNFYGIRIEITSVLGG